VSIDILPLKEFRNNYPAAVILGISKKDYLDLLNSL